jgi:hypothetical protein
MRFSLARRTDFRPHLLLHTSQQIKISGGRHDPHDRAATADGWLSVVEGDE